MVVKLFEIKRIIAVGLGFFLAYFYGGSAEEIIHLLLPWLIIPIMGFSAVEGLFFGKDAARAKGYGANSAYQIQTALFFLSITFMSIWLYFVHWGVWSEITLLFTFLLSLLLSAINHTYQAIAHGNYTWNNLIRPIGVIALIASVYYPLSQIL
ncbi:MAG: hypothetical protein A2W85_08575 [Bacteroidetes bacterium GWF2_41_31]|nr:MAG: hypothetical protein A2W85_08575 [Bacteroidetes bacterium GWF2_41_31]